jgi:hypothetical protein
LRRALKSSRTTYANLWHAHSIAIKKALVEVITSAKATAPTTTPLVLPMFRLTMAQVHHQLAMFGFDTHYRSLLLAVLTQVQRFPQTMLPNDGVTAAEISFERSLRAMRDTDEETKLKNEKGSGHISVVAGDPSNERWLFYIHHDYFNDVTTSSVTVPITTTNTSTTDSKVAVATATTTAAVPTTSSNEASFINRIIEMAQVHILPRAPKSSEKKVTGGVSVGSGNGVPMPQSFRADRRLLRLIMFRMMLNQFLSHVGVAIIPLPVPPPAPTIIDAVAAVTASTTTPATTSATLTNTESTSSGTAPAAATSINH